jgi:hypothetical protein
MIAGVPRFRKHGVTIAVAGHLPSSWSCFSKPVSCHKGVNKRTQIQELHAYEEVFAKKVSLISAYELAVRVCCFYERPPG